MAGRWIAGSTVLDAVKRSQGLNKDGIGTIINYLGEDLADEKKIKKTVTTYLKLINSIKAFGLNASISLKPTQIGLSISKKEFLANYRRIVNSAKKEGIFVWLDMEDSKTVEDTIFAYIANVKMKNTGICIQSYLKRSKTDILRILKAQGTIRLVKGAYKESYRIAYNSRVARDKNFVDLMNILFQKGRSFTIATHDMEMINKAEVLERRYKRKVRFAMLNGIRNKEVYKLAKNGHLIDIYLPFGEDWIDYSIRRLREFSNVKLVARSLISR